jgi:hypothetical protein
MSANDLLSSFNFRHFKRLRSYWRGQVRAGQELDNIDLDLLAAGLLHRSENLGQGIALTITLAGEQAMAERHKTERLWRKPHHALAGRLSQWLREQGRVTWEEIELVVRDSEGNLHTVKPPVFSVATEFTRKKINPVIHVVVNDRAAFLDDLHHVGRRAFYARLAEEIVYVAPDGVVQLEEVPRECGLLLEGADGQFKQLKRPHAHAVALTAHNFMSLILKPGAMTERSLQVAAAVKRLSAKSMAPAESQAPDDAADRSEPADRDSDAWAQQSVRQ